MSTDPAVAVRPARPASGLLIATRLLAAVHGLAGLAVLGYAVVLFADYRNASDDDSLAGLVFLIGFAAAVLGGLLVVLSLGALLVRHRAVAGACGLAAALLGLGASCLVGWLLPSGGGVAVSALPVALAVCAVVGIVRREDS